MPILAPVCTLRLAPELRSTLIKELNFLDEAHNAERAERELKNDRVYIPKVRWDMSSERVLVAEWIDGFRVDDGDQIEAHGWSKRSVCKTLLDVVSNRSFVCSFLQRTR